MSQLTLYLEGLNQFFGRNRLLMRRSDGDVKRRKSFEGTPRQSNEPLAGPSIFQQQPYFFTNWYNIRSIFTPFTFYVGCLGQLGKGLMKKLAKSNKVIGTDIKEAPSDFTYNFEPLDVTDKSMVSQMFKKHKPSHVIHLSAILSGAGEKNPDLAMKVNLDGFMNVLEMAKEHKCQLFSPSTIAAFGPDTPPNRTPDSTIMRPTTIYGITKVHMELMGEYYHSKYGVDFRSVRLPGVISPEPIHGMGTTDYAVEIFQNAAQKKPYTCYLGKDSRLPMMYIDDTISAILKLVKAPSEALKRRVYNVTGLDFTPEELASAIQAQVDFDFKVSYKPDFRQAIADSWPNSLRDTCARKDWKWAPKVNSLEKLVSKMFKELKS